MKKLGIMQPYFFPYLGYFALIENAEQFIFFDTPQYILHGWVNRNRILNLRGEPAYMTVPIKKAARSTPIKDIEIDYSYDWKNKLWGMLTVYKKKAPYYSIVMELLQEILEKKYTLLSHLNITSTAEICKYLGITSGLQIFSEMHLQLPDIMESDEWALYITEAMGYQTYINPPGGISFFDRNKYILKGIKLEFLEVELKPYIQKIGHFEKALSIIDVMMFCNAHEILDMLHNVNLN